MSQTDSSKTESIETEWISESVTNALRAGIGRDLLSVVLFGSRARGDAFEGSDWDVLVVARNLPAGTLGRVAFLKRMLPEEFRGEVSLLAKTPEEFTIGVSELYLDVAMDGRVLYDTRDFMAERLGCLRAGIHARGLRRERDGRDLIWRFPPGTNPLPDWEEAR